MAGRKTYNTVDCKEQLLLTEIKNGEYGGYKPELLENSLNEMEIDFYVCTKCNGIMRNACQIGDGYALACEMCAMEELFSQPMVKSRKNIPTLRARCPLVSRGCMWKGTIGEFDVHLDACPEFVITCSNICDVLLKRSELKNHCKNECLKRKVNCIHCKIVFQYKEIDNHFTICSELPLLCTNECMQAFLRKEMNSHIEKDCPNTIVHCTNECGLKMKRAELSIHCEHQCQFRIISCEYCEVVMKYKALENHYKQCLEFPLLCPKDCLKNVSRKELKLHVEEECPNTIVACLYKEMGCEEKIKRYMLQEHEKTFESKHLNLTMSHYSKRVETMEDHILNLEKENKQLIDKVKNVEIQFFDKDKENKQLTSRVKKLGAKLQHKNNEIERLIASSMGTGSEEIKYQQKITKPPDTPSKFLPISKSSSLFEVTKPNEYGSGACSKDNKPKENTRAMLFSLSRQMPEKRKEHLRIEFLYLCRPNYFSLWNRFSWEINLVALADRELLIYNTATDYYSGRVSDTLIMNLYTVSPYKDYDMSDKPRIPPNCSPENGFIVKKGPLTESYFVADNLESSKKWMILLEMITGENEECF